jgi:hypothetical protein
VIGRLRGILQADEANLILARQARTSALTACEALSATEAKARVTSAARDAAAANYTSVDDAFREAERLRGEARLVGDTARDVRTSIARRVFKRKPQYPLAVNSRAIVALTHF